MRTTLIVTQIFYVLFGFVWLLIEGMSVMLFDSGSSPLAWIIFGFLTAYPVAVVVCSILAWIFFVKKRRRLSLILDLVPSLWIVIIFGSFAVARFTTG